jgi:hypothetical protein
VDDQNTANGERSIFGGKAWFKGKCRCDYKGNGPRSQSSRHQAG